MGKNDHFEGAKLALYLGDKLAVILRDDVPDLVFAGYWDLPGGGREGGETPWRCAQRECFEELGLQVPKEAVVWARPFEEGCAIKWFFVAQLPREAAGDVVFGDEGQRWALMDTAAFLGHAKAVPAFQDRLRMYVHEHDAGHDQRGE